MKKRILPWLPVLVLTLAGAAGGWLYYRLVGCATGTCAISSNPFVSTVYGGVIGLLLGFVVKPSRKKNNQEDAS
jgi:hypothetical protein